MMDEVGCLVMGKSSNLGGLMRKMINDDRKNVE